MLLKIECDLPKFKTIDFKPGLNLIVAGQGKKVAKGSTRNGRGKSSVIEILHYCLGGDVPKKGRTLAKREMREATFSLTLTFNGKLCKISRVGTEREVIVEGETDGWLHQPEKSGDYRILSLAHWKEVLGDKMFGLSPSSDDPSFRSLVSYFIRDGKGAYLQASSTHPNQSSKVTRPLHAFLLGLEWKKQKQLEALRTKRDNVARALKTIKQGMFDYEGMSASKMRSKELELASRVEELEERLSSYRVHENYREIEVGVNDATREIHQLSQDNVEDRSLISHYEHQRQSEEPPDVEQLYRLFEEAGLIFPGSVSKTIEDASEFHADILRDRREFLKKEQDRLSRHVEERENRIEQLDSSRSEKMSILETHGALDEYVKLQSQVQDVRDELNIVEDRIRVRSDQEHRLAQLKLECTRLATEISDYLESQQGVKHTYRLQRLYSEASKAMYGKAKSTISFESSDLGVEIEIEKTDGSGSDGIDNAALLCHDLMMMAHWSECDPNPGMLVHDGRIFDPIDSRQRKSALVLASKWAEQYGFQYITMFNSDMIPDDLFDDKGIDPDSVILELKDKGKTGGLFGILF